MWTINLCKLIRWKKKKKKFVFVIFKQKLKICFRTRMAFLLWRCQFDCLGRISLNTPLQPLDWYEWETVEERKHKTMSSIQYSVTDGNMLLHWSKVSSNLRFTQTLNIAFTVLLLCICEVVAVNWFCAIKKIVSVNLTSITALNLSVLENDHGISSSLPH